MAHGSFIIHSEAGDDKLVSLRLFLAAVKSFSSQELIVRRSTKQDFFELSVRYGTSLIRQFFQNGALCNEF